MLDDNSFQTFVYNNILWRAKPGAPTTLQKSLDWGANWIDLKSNFTYNVGDIIVFENGNILVEQDPDSDSTVGSTQPSSLYLSTDGGITFGGSPVLTMSNAGSLFFFSYDVKGNTAFIGEYGKYDAVYVYRTVNGGVSFDIVFTHPTSGSLSSHIHRVYMDKWVDGLVFVSLGDNSGNRGVYYTTNNGGTWTRIISATSWQPTWIDSNRTYVFFGEDGGGTNGAIHRALKSKIIAGTFVQAADYETVYEATEDTRGNFEEVSWYAGAVDDGGRIYFGSLSYGQDSTFNGGDSLLLFSDDDGDNWEILATYNALSGSTSHGCTFLSKQQRDGKLYMTVNQVGGATRDVLTINTLLLGDRIRSSGRIKSGTRIKS